MQINYDRIYDITMPITYSMPVYKGREEKRPQLIVEREFSTGEVHESRLSMNLHTGTHLDRPLHIIPGGETVETLKLDQVVTACRVLDFTEVDEKISQKDLEAKNIRENDFILLKTRNSFEDNLEKDFIYLDKTAAGYLAQQKVKGVGIDSLGIERNQPEHETHITLLKAGIHILEGLSLREIPEDEYFLFAAPVNIVGAEAAPVRAILLK
jgi:arylformamidase